VFADPYLTLPVIANGIYQFEFHLFLFGVSTADVSTRVAFPTGAEISIGQQGPEVGLVSSATIGQGDWRGHESDNTSPSITLSFGTSDLTNRVYGVVEGLATIGATSGSLTLEWGNALSNVSGVEILHGSYMILTRVG
jgi:hypothetical protein